MPAAGVLGFDSGQLSLDLLTSQFRRAAPLARFCDENANKTERRALHIVARLCRACKSGAVSDLRLGNDPAVARASMPGLLDLDRRHAFKLLLDRLRLVLGRVLLQGFRRPIDQVLGFLQAERRHFAHRLDGVDLVRARIL
jgi:hypothetical protein